MCGLKVLHLIPGICDGGIERMLLSQYSKNFHSHEISVATLNPVISKQKNDFQKMGFVVHSPNKISRLKYISFLINLIKKNKFNLIHLHLGESTWKVVAICVLFGFRAKIFIHSHNFYSRQNMNFKIILNLALTKIAMKIKPAYKLACSKEAGDWLFGKGKRFSIIKNSFNTNEFLFNSSIRKATRVSLGIGLNENVAIFVGRLEAQKQPEKVINFFCSDNIHNFDKLIIIGSGSLGNDLKKYVLNCGVKNNVIFLGSVRNVKDFLFAADCFIASSSYEGLGIAAVEAYITGMEVVLSKAFPNEILTLDGVMNLDEYKPRKQKEYLYENLAKRQKKSSNRKKIINELGYSNDENVLYKLHKKALGL